LLSDGTREQNAVKAVFPAGLRGAIHIIAKFGAEFSTAAVSMRVESAERLSVRVCFH
jgi:hypothetical protein